MTPTDISGKQLAANRRNAQHSTGPKTPEGRERSRFNGVRHGLTGRTVVLPWEDMTVYKQFSEELVESFNPKTPFERQLAQTIADAQWRLNRARSWEDGMLCMGAHGPAGDFDAENPQVHAALAASQVFQQDSKSFANLTLYENRLQRQQKQAFEQLQAIQAQRKAEEKSAMEQAKLLHKQHKMLGKVYNPAESAQAGGPLSAFSKDGFAFSTAEIEAECMRERRLYEATLARNVGYNREIFEAKLAKMAA